MGEYASPENVEIGKRLREMRRLEDQVTYASYAAGNPTPHAYMDRLVDELRDATIAYHEALINGVEVEEAA